MNRTLWKRTWRCGVLLPALSLTLAGCEPTKPPTPAEQRMYATRLAVTTTMGHPELHPYTKLIEFSQPHDPVAGSVGTVELKVFSAKDQKDGTHPEWKYFHPLPAAPAKATASEVLMEAWLISRDGTVFLHSRPSLKDYGTFLTDWIMPHAGDYNLYAIYQPAYQDEDKPWLRSQVFRIEVARRPIKIAGPSPLPATLAWSPSPTADGNLLLTAPTGGTAPVPVSSASPHVGEPFDLMVPSALVSESGVQPNLVVVSADGTDFQQIMNAAGHFEVSFANPGLYKLWISAGGPAYSAVIRVQP